MIWKENEPKSTVAIRDKMPKEIERNSILNPFANRCSKKQGKKIGDIRLGIQKRQFQRISMKNQNWWDLFTIHQSRVITKYKKGWRFPRKILYKKSATFENQIFRVQVRFLSTHKSIYLMTICSHQYKALNDRPAEKYSISKIYDTQVLRPQLKSVETKRGTFRWTNSLH